MNGLAVCAGIGGIEIGISRVLEGYRTVCYIEREAYAAAVLVKQMEEGGLDPAPVWDDIETFDGRPWRGVVDLITAGLPCQPFSVAGKQQGEDDERYLWPEFFRILGEVQPALVFLENVPNFLAFFRPVGEELSEMGYEFEAGLFSAIEVGAEHTRERFFCLAHTASHRLQEERVFPKEVSSGPWNGYPHRTVGPIRTRAPEWCFQRVANGDPQNLDRLRCLGNAVVPATAEKAFRTLLGRLS